MTEKDIYAHLHYIFENELSEFPSGMGYFLGDGNEDIFIVYLPYDDDVSSIADDEVKEITYRLKIDIIARNGKSFSQAEKRVKEVFKSHGFMYQNGEMSVDTKEPYDYHRILNYNIHQYFDDIENI